MKSTVVVLAMLAAAPLSAATVVNGSFESTYGPGDVVQRSTWGVHSSLPGVWTTTSGPGIEIQTNATLTQIDAQDGNHYVELDSHTGTDTNSSMTQSVFLDAGNYQLSFYYSPRTSNAGSNGIDFSIASLSGNITGPGNGVAVGSWTQVIRDFTVGVAGNYNLTFAATGRDDSLGGFVDNVSIAPVPLPAAGIMLLAGLGGLGVMRARKRA